MAVRWYLRYGAGFEPTASLQHGPSPTEVVTDKAAVYPPVLEENALGAWHHTERYANNRIESDHGRLKSRLRPMRGLKSSAAHK